MNNNGKTESPQNIKLLSREVHEIFSDKPGWFVRYGIMISMVNVLIMLLITWLVKYPDVMVMDAQLTDKPRRVNVASLDAGFIVEIIIPQQHPGKLANDQQVILKFEAYPFEKFGSVAGKIIEVSPIDAGNSSLVRTYLPYGLNTNNHKSIIYRNGLSAQAEIRIGEKRLLQILAANILEP